MNIHACNKMRRVTISESLSLKPSQQLNRLSRFSNGLSSRVILHIAAQFFPLSPCPIEDVYGCQRRRVSLQLRYKSLPNFSNRNGIYNIHTYFVPPRINLIFLPHPPLSFQLIIFLTSVFLNFAESFHYMTPRKTSKTRLVLFWKRYNNTQNKTKLKQYLKKTFQALD